MTELLHHGEDAPRLCREIDISRGEILEKRKNDRSTRYGKEASVHDPCGPTENTSRYGGGDSVGIGCEQHDHQLDGTGRRQL